MQIPFLSDLFRTGDKPRNYYIGTDFRYLFGPSAGGKTVNEFTAMQTTAVYACTEYFVKKKKKRRTACSKREPKK